MPSFATSPDLLRFCRRFRMKIIKMMPKMTTTSSVIITPTITPVELEVPSAVLSLWNKKMHDFNKMAYMYFENCSTMKAIRFESSSLYTLLERWVII